MIGRRLVALALLGLAAYPSHAEAWPDRPVRVIVPFAPGGATDVAARLVADVMGRSMGATFVIENRGGAGGNIGMAEASRSPPDGSTILVMNDAIASNPHYYKLNFDPVADLVPVIQLTRQPIVVAVHPGLGVSSLADLVALAKQRPDLTYATAGAGSQHHIVMTWFASQAGIKLSHVPYRGGGLAVNDLVGGHVPIAALASTPFIPLAQSGEVKMIAQSMDRRAASLPGVPTFKESGFADVVLDQWTGVFVPKGTAESIIVRLHAEAQKALRDPQVLAKLDGLAVEVVGGSRDQFAEVVRADNDKYRNLLSRLGLSVPR